MRHGVHYNSSAVAEMGDRAEQSGPKSGGCCAPFHEGAESPSNTVWPGPRPTSVPSGILIHPTVWPQYTNVSGRQTDRHDIQDNGPIAMGELFKMNKRLIF